MKVVAVLHPSTDAALMANQLHRVRVFKDVLKHVLDLITVVVRTEKHQRWVLTGKVARVNTLNMVVVLMAKHQPKDQILRLAMIAAIGSMI